MFPPFITGTCTPHLPFTCWTGRFVPLGPHREGAAAAIMERRDHLMHQIDQLGLVLQRLLGKLLGSPDPGTTLESTMDQLTAALGEAVTDVDRDPQDMLDAIAADPAFTTANAEQLAELFWGMGASGRVPAESPHVSRAYRERALLILEHLNATDRTYSFERHAKVAEWRGMLGG